MIGAPAIDETPRSKAGAFFVCEGNWPAPDVDRRGLHAQAWGHWQGGHAMSQPIETTRQQITEKALSLADAAAHLGWSRRTLIRALVRHGITMIGSGGGPRLEMADLELLKAMERRVSGISSEP